MTSKEFPFSRLTAILCPAVLLVLSTTPAVTAQLQAPLIKDSPTVTFDGTLQPGEWEDAGAVAPVGPLEFDDPDWGLLAVTVYALHNNFNLYLGFKVEVEYPLGLTDDGVILFFDPEVHDGPTLQNDVAFSYFSDQGTPESCYQGSGSSWAAFTPCDLDLYSSDTAQGWHLEMIIPFGDLNGIVPNDQDELGFAFIVVNDYGDYEPDDDIDDNDKDGYVVFPDSLLGTFPIPPAPAITLSNPVDVFINNSATKFKVPAEWTTIQFRRPNLSVIPTNIDFGTVKIDDPPSSISFTIANNDDDDIDLIYQILGLGPPFSYSSGGPGTENPLGYLDSQPHQIQFTPTVPGGAGPVFENITSNDEEEVQLTINGTGAWPVLNVTGTEGDLPNLTLPFGKVTKNTVKSSSFTIINDGAVSLEVTGIAKTGSSDFTITAPVGDSLPDIGPGLSGQIDIAFNPSTLGPASATTLSFATDDNDTYPAVTVELTGTGVEREIVLVLDASGSMRKFSPEGDRTDVRDETRLWEMGQAVEVFLNKVDTATSAEAVKIDVIFFPDPDLGGDTSKSLFGDLVDLSGNLNTIETTLDTISLGWGGTPLWSGLDEGRLRLGLADVNKSRALVLFSDGYNTEGTKPLTIADDVLETGARVYTIGYGHDGALEGFSAGSSADKAVLDEIRQYSDPDGSFADIEAGETDFAALKKQAFDEICVDVLNLTMSTDPGGHIDAGEHKVHFLPVDEFNRQLIFHLYWNTPAEGEMLELALQTPDCQLIDRHFAEQDPRVLFREGATYQILTVKEDLVQPGGWQLQVSNPYQTADQEPYSYGLITDSGLSMSPTFGKSSYTTGEAMEIRAVLRGNGIPLTGASIAVGVERPKVSFNNWLAKNFVSARDLSQAPTEFLGEPAHPRARRAHVIHQSGVPLDTEIVKEQMLLFDDGVHGGDQAAGDGVYSGVFSKTGVPGTYRFKFEARGVTPAGFAFLRENLAQRRVSAIPAPEGMVLDAVWDQVFIEQELKSVVSLVIRATDALGNHVIDDRFLDDLEITVGNGSLRGAPVNNYDGSYAQEIVAAAPGVTLEVEIDYRDGTIIRRLEIPTLTGMRFADTVVAFSEGAEASPGVNEFDDPASAVTPPAESQTRRSFTSLGGGGSLTLEAADLAVYDGAGTDFIVFELTADANLPETSDSYTVEVKTRQGFVSLGEVGGGMAQFDLGAYGISEITEIRITDTSQKILGEQGRPLSTPGADIEAVGVRYLKGRSAKGSFELTLPFAGQFLFDDVLGLEDGEVFGAKLGYRLNPRTTLELEGGITSTETRETGRSGEVWQLLFNWRYRWFADSRQGWEPYVTAGAGMLFFRDLPIDDDAATLQAGIGARYMFGGSLGLDLESRVFRTEAVLEQRASESLQVTAGLVVKLK